MRTRVASLLALILSGCASIHAPPDAVAVVSIAELNAHPERWDGRRVQVTGLIVAEFENLGLYASWRDYCPRKTYSRAIYVPWDDQADFPQSQHRRMATVRGVFRNLNGVERMVGGQVEMIISTSAPGAGPLEDVEVVQWHGPQRPFCER
jgi:hypothetical protein